MADSVEAYIDQNQGRFVEELKEFMRFPSVSAQRAHDKDTRACAEWVVAQLKGLGFEAGLVDVGGQPIVRALRKGKTSKRVMIYGHYDVQPEDPVAEWKTPPFEPTVRDGTLYGRGATDDKGQVWAHVKAVESLIKAEGDLPCEVLFLLEGEEESGGDALPRYVQQAKDEIKPDVVVISDSTMYDANTPALTYGLRGIIALEFTVRGPAADLHSGAYGGGIANPAMVVAQILAKCVGSDGKILVPGFYDDVVPLQDWERESFAKLKFDDAAMAKELNVPRPHGEPGYTTLERLWARPTFEVNGIFGGYQGQRSKTIIPAWATAKVTCRLVSNQDPARVHKAVVDHIRNVCPDTVRIEINDFGASPPVLFDVNNPTIRAAQEALKKGFGHDATFIRCGGSIPVVSTFVDHLGCPVILMGFGLDSDGPHSPNEHFSLDSFVKGTKSAMHMLRMI